MEHQCITLYPLPGSLISTNAIATGPDGALWFTRDGEGAEVGRITTTGTVSLYSLPSAGDYAYTGGIAAGPDGALWFTRQDATTNVSWLGRITTAGQITQYAIPAPGGSPQSIVQGPDHAMWFAESSGDIARAGQ
jgi:virginiamycin B lyase